MKIAHIEIQNFRKLRSCRVEIGERETLLVGANNSGKTSAIEALILFLKNDRNKEIRTTDLTLSNWHTLNEIGKAWLQVDETDFGQVSREAGEGSTDWSNFYLDIWRDWLPSLDLWLNVGDEEIHYVSHLIPSLEWQGGLIGVRLILEPKVNKDQQIEDLYRDFVQAVKAVQSAVTAANAGDEPSTAKEPKLWPQSLREFLDKKLHNYFTINAYLLDPAKLEDPVDGVARPQRLEVAAYPITQRPFDGLFKVDVINAQRGFNDPHSSDDTASSTTSLSAQFRSYYDNHLNPSELPEPEDVDALSAIEEAKGKFDEKLKSSFQSAIAELETMGYPGFADPKIMVTTDVKPIDGLAHESAVQFKVDSSDGETSLALPERYNGLGYQNLVSMVFRLIRYRDEWMKVGKAGKRQENTESVIEPLHLVLIEEPEAHLHAQVQQVFIKNAYKVLRARDELKGDQFTTQLVLSTHSSHIAHEVNFSDLRYFRRLPAQTETDVPCASLVNLTETFGRNDDTAKFSARYLKTTHCDLFFADAVILVEGPAERMLVPHFIRNHFCVLDSRYLTVLEIGGSHAHKLRPLIEKLGIFCLVITDLDSIKKPPEEKAQKVRPERGQGYFSGNDTLKSWLPSQPDLDQLLGCTDEKVSTNGLVRAAYPSATQVEFDAGIGAEEAIPYTFEDALVLANIELFKKVSATRGLIKKMQAALGKPTLSEASQEMFDALGKSAKKAEMALDLLFFHEPEELITPPYIAEGLEWLQDKLEIKDKDFVTQGVEHGT